MFNPDDFLMDKIVQPIVNRLPEHISCFDVAAFCSKLFLLTNIMEQIRIVLTHVNPQDVLLVAFVYVFTDYTLYKYMRVSIAVGRSTRIDRLNPNRVDRGDIAATWLYILWVVANTLGIVFHLVSFDFGDIAGYAAVFTYCFLRAQRPPPEKEGLNMSNNTDQTISNLEANSLDAPPGWIRPEVYAAALDKARAYRRQIIAAGIKPDLETYRDD